MKDCMIDIYFNKIKIKYGSMCKLKCYKCIWNNVLKICYVENLFVLIEVESI